jgi:hypothetical protein
MGTSLRTWCDAWFLGVNVSRPGRGSPEGVGAESLCHQAIFMNHAPGAVTPPNPEMVQVGGAVGQRA